MAQFVRCRKSLDAHSTIRCHEDTRNRIVEKGSKKAPERSHQKRKPDGMNRSKHVDVSTVTLDHGAHVESTM
jgi:hypothetical protein